MSYDTLDTLAQWCNIQKWPHSTQKYQNATNYSDLFNMLLIRQIKELSFEKNSATKEVITGGWLWKNSCILSIFCSNSEVYTLFIIYALSEKMVELSVDFFFGSLRYRIFNISVFWMCQLHVEFRERLCRKNTMNV